MISATVLTIIIIIKKFIVINSCYFSLTLSILIINIFKAFLKLCFDGGFAATAHSVFTFPLFIVLQTEMDFIVITCHDYTK